MLNEAVGDKTIFVLTESPSLLTVIYLSSGGVTGLQKRNEYYIRVKLSLPLKVKSPVKHSTLEFLL